MRFVDLENEALFKYPGNELLYIKLDSSGGIYIERWQTKIFACSSPLERVVPYIAFPVMGVKDRPTFPDGVDVIKTYAINLLELYLMRVQIPGNEMTDEVRSAFRHFLGYDKQHKPKIISRLITSLLSPDKNDMSDGMSDLDYYILQRFCDIMNEDLGKMDG